MKIKDENQGGKSRMKIKDENQGGKLRRKIRRENQGGKSRMKINHIIRIPNNYLASKIEQIQIQKTLIWTNYSNI